MATPSTHLLKIFTFAHQNGVTLTGRYAPKRFSVTFSDLDKDTTARDTANGYLKRDVIRMRVRQIELEWGKLTRGEISSLLSYFNADKVFYADGVIGYGGIRNNYKIWNGFLVVEYPDPAIASGVQKRVFYPSDRTMPVQLYNYTTNEWEFEGLSITLIER